MPRYYFDTNDGRSLAVDQTGLDLATMEEVRWAALDALPDMARDALPRHPVREISVQVRDEEGRVVFTASLVLITRQDGRSMDPETSNGVSPPLASPMM